VVRFIPALDDHGRWGALDTTSTLRYMGVARYDAREAAEAFADILNATDEGESVGFVEGLRSDLDALR
jgi:hypothetical protein